MKSSVASFPCWQGAQTLDKAEVGCDLRICCLKGPGCERLRALGFCERLRIRKLSCGRNLLCSLCGTRVALSRKLAEQIMVTRGR